jgi:hypothetical protein
MTIAPNQDFVLASVPRREAGTASGILGTAQRVGTALGIAIIGTVLFGTLAVKPGPDAVAVAFSHSAELALLANVGFVAAALILVVALPRRIPDPGSRGLGSAVPGQAPSVRRPWSDRGRGGAAGVPDRLAQVAAGDHGDELVDRVLLGGQRARDGVR